MDISDVIGLLFSTTITLSMIYTVLYVEQYIWLMAILYPHIVQEYSISSKIEERDRSKSLHSRNSTKQYGPVYFMTWKAGDSNDSIDSNMHGIRKDIYRYIHPLYFALAKTSDDYLFVKWLAFTGIFITMYHRLQ